MTTLAEISKHDEFGVRENERMGWRWFSPGAHATPLGRARIVSHIAEKRWATEAHLTAIRDVLVAYARERKQQPFALRGIYNARAAKFLGAMA